MRWFLCSASIVATSFLTGASGGRESTPEALLKAQPARRLEPAPSPVDNPLKGLVPYDNPLPNRFPHSLEFFYLPLSDLMIGPNLFDWSSLERKLDAIARRGNQAIFRIWVEYPTLETGVPTFLIEQGVKLTRWRNPFENSWNVTPDYGDERLIKALEQFIAALGARYDNDPRVGFLTAGLLGSWGEWHTWPRDDLAPSPEVERRVMNAYEAAFKQVPILLRYPAGPNDPVHADNASRTRFGYHDDSFAWATLDTGREEDSWFFLAALKRAGPQAMARWTIQPIGGEIRPELWDSLFDPHQPPHPKGQNFDECVRQTHVTWLMDSGMFHKPVSPARRQRALESVRRMGYDFRVTTARLNRQENRRLTVELTVINQGVAPFYRNWPLELGWLDRSTGRVIARFPVDWSLTNLLPDAPARVWRTTLTLPPASGNENNCILALRVVHPLPNGKPLRFANADQDRHAPGWLSLGTPNGGASKPPRPSRPRPRRLAEFGALDD